MRALALTTCLCLLATAARAEFTVQSPDIRNGAPIPTVHVFTGCGGGNVSPALSWSGEPQGTKSFAITMYDPDAPTGSGWWHWTVFDIPGMVHSLPANAGVAQAGAASAGAMPGGAMPAGAMQGRTDFGFSNYGGPCPPAGDKPHHYIITVYALKVPSLASLNAQSAGAMVGFQLHFNTLATAKLTGVYGRAK